MGTAGWTTCWHGYRVDLSCELSTRVGGITDGADWNASYVANGAATRRAG